jgi:hypothetical protein
MRRLLQANFHNLHPVPAAVPTLELVWVDGPAARTAPWPVESSWRGPGALA